MGASTKPVPLRLGPYELLQRIASGGMAEVYLARRAGPRGFQKHFALKRILPQLARDPDFCAMFVDEARVCARLGHPNLVQVFDFGEHDGELYMAMEYVEGTTGARLIRAAATRGEDIPLDVALHLALSVLRGLDYAHNARDEEDKPLSLVHRDVSPGNVLIDRSGAVKLTDFGIARIAECERRTEDGQLKGKLGYMSPEQVTGKELDGRSDLFTLGIVLAELVMLRPLFSGGGELDVLMRIRDADLSQLDRNASRIPDDVRAVLYRALAKDPLLRYPTAAAFAEAIEEIVRRRRLQVGPAKLASWIERLGLAKAASGEHDPVADEDESGMRSTQILSVDAKVRGTTPDMDDVAPQIYRIQQMDGTAVGPVAYPMLVELFATGRANTKSMIARESGEFREALEYPELTRFVTSSALRWDEELPHDAERTKIDRARFPARLLRAAIDRETGLMLLKDGAKQKKIYLVEGIPEFIVSTERTELLGEYLISRGQVLRMEVDMALAMLPRFGGRVGDALVGLGVLRPVELFRAINDQIQFRFAEVLAWKQGEIIFVRGMRSHEETFPLAIDPFEVIARGVNDGYWPSELEEILGHLDADIISPVMPLPVRIETFRLPERETRVLTSIDGKSTLGGISDRMLAGGHASREEVLRAVFIGLSCQILRTPKWFTEI